MHGLVYVACVHGKANKLFKSDSQRVAFLLSVGLSD